MKVAIPRARFTSTKSGVVLATARPGAGWYAFAHAQPIEQHHYVITDATALAEINNSWKGVRELQQRIRNNTVFGFVGGGIAATNLGRLAHNLPFLHACAVLNEALLALRDQGAFRCKQFFLGALHQASRTALPWADWALIQGLIQSRNDLAHSANVVPVDDCLRYVDAIEHELQAWGVL